MSRLKDEAIMLGDDIEITIIDIRGDYVRLGLHVTQTISVRMKESSDTIKKNNKQGLLVIRCKKNESVMIGDDIEVIIVDVRGDKARIGLVAPKPVPVHRKEIYDAIQMEKTRQKQEDKHE